MRKSLCRPKASFDRAEKGLTVQPDKGKENPSASDASSSREQKSREKTYGEAILLARDRATEREMRALGALLARTNLWWAWTGTNQVVREPNPFHAEGLPSRED
jgi:hypothetical protein